MFHKKLTKKITTSSTSTPTITGDWFYMNSKELSARAIYDAITAIDGIQPDVWDEINILEIELSDTSTIDFEPMKPFFRDEVGEAFLKQHEITTLFMVTFVPTSYDLVSKVMKEITTILGGFFCADTSDFAPLIK